MSSFGNELHHLFLDLGEIFRGYLIFSGIDIIVETVFNSGADAEFHSGIKFLKSLGKEVGR